MSSLSAHLRESGEHSRLPFHPGCPTCRRERLAGSLDGEELVSRRTQAAIAAGLLAFSAVGVPAAAAQEPDQVSEGTEEVVAEGGGDASSNADIELEGDVLPVSDEAPAAPTTDSADEDGPLEEDLGLEIQGTGVDTTEDAAAVVPEEPAPAPEPVPATPAPVAPEPTPAPPAEPAVESADPGPVAVAPARREARKRVERDRREPAAAAAPAPAVVAQPAPAAEPAPAPAAEPAPAPVETVRVVSRSSGSRAGSGDRFHTVRPGESLWSIAADVLGDRATVPRIAREVNRLWELNDDLIGTGRPDLLYAGTRLRLR